MHSVRQNPQTLIVVTDGLKSMSQAIDDLFTQAQHQTYIVHLIRVITDFVSRKDRKAVMVGLKLIYRADSPTFRRHVLRAVLRTQEGVEEARLDAAQARKNEEVREELAQTESRDCRASSAYRQCPS